MSEAGYVEEPILEWLSGHGSTTTGFAGLGWIYRNELIADLFHRMDKGERAGTGIRRMNEAMKAVELYTGKFTKLTNYINMDNIKWTN